MSPVAGRIRRCDGRVVAETRSGTLSLPPPNESAARRRSRRRGPQPWGANLTRTVPRPIIGASGGRHFSSPVPQRSALRIRRSACPR